jgi:hypothetical protein
MALLFFQSPFNCSNYFKSFSEKVSFDNDERSGWTAFIHAVYQNEAIAKMDCRILLSPFRSALS